jgi:hypothetical protein
VRVEVAVNLAGVVLGNGDGSAGSGWPAGGEREPFTEPPAFELQAARRPGNDVNRFSYSIEIAIVAANEGELPSIEEQKESRCCDIGIRNPD